MAMAEKVPKRVSENGNGSLQARPLHGKLKEGVLVFQERWLSWAFRGHPLAALGMTVAALTVLGMLLGAVLGVVWSLTVGLIMTILSFGLSVAGSATLGGFFGAFAGFFLAFRLCLLLLERAMLYHPRRYGAGQLQLGQLRLGGEQEYVLEKASYPLADMGSQAALLLRPTSVKAEKLWVFFGGNAMVAADWVPFLDRVLRHQGVTSTSAFLLVDYPSYGFNDGHPSPERILEASRKAIFVAKERVQKTEAPLEVHLLGHSLGAAAAVQAAVSLSEDGLAVGRLIMSAPFLSIPHMALHMGGLLAEMKKPSVPAGALKALAKAEPLFQRSLPLIERFFYFLVPQVWCNITQVQKAARAGWDISLIHGTSDEIVPVTMGRELHKVALAERRPEAALLEYTDVPGANHNDVMLRALPTYSALLACKTADDKPSTE